MCKVDGYMMVADLSEGGDAFFCGVRVESLSEYCMCVDVFECCFSWCEYCLESQPANMLQVDCFHISIFPICFPDPGIFT